MLPTPTILLAVLSLTLTTKLTQGTITSCTYKTPCACTTNEGKVIDLKDLDKLVVNDVANKNDYGWRPCQTFNIGKLKGVTAYQHAQSTNVYYDIGSDPNVKFAMNGGKVELDLTSKAADRSTKITLNCTSGKTAFLFVGENPETTYNFFLNSPYCCPNHSSSGSGSSSLSVGSILLIVFFVLLIVYFIFGAVFLTKVRHAEGKEKIPNVVFWAALPLLIRDGFKFTIGSCCLRNSTYAQI